MARFPARILRRFRRDDRGVSAVEFGMLLPVMMMLYFGAVEVSNVLIADRKATNVASTAADLATQSIALADADIADIFGASAAVLAPYDPSTVEIVLSSASDDGTGTVRVDWSDAHNTAPRGEGESIDVPDNLIMTNGSVVVAEVRYVYTSPIGKFITGPFTVSDTFYMRPRRSLVVGRID